MGKKEKIIYPVTHYLTIEKIKETMGLTSKEIDKQLDSGRVKTIKDHGALYLSVEDIVSALESGG